MADETKPQNLPAKRKLALTEDEHALIESYRQRNLAVDSFNKALDVCLELLPKIPDEPNTYTYDEVFGIISKLSYAIKAKRLKRVSIL